MDHENYRIQNGCHNCQHAFYHVDWDSPPSIFCSRGIQDVEKLPFRAREDRGVHVFGTCPDHEVGDKSKTLHHWTTSGNRKTLSNVKEYLDGGSDESS